MMLEAYAFVLPLEMADSTYTQMEHGVGDCAGADASTAAAVYNVNDDGYHNKVAFLTLRGFKYTSGGGNGLHVKGATTKPYNTTVEAITVESTQNSVNGFNIEAAPGTELISPQARLTGTASYPITFWNGSHRSKSSGGSSHMGAGATAGMHVRILDSDHVEVSPLPHCTHASGTLGQALAITNSTGSKMLGGALIGTITVALLLTADGSGKTIAQCEVGRWSGDGGNIGCVEANSGTIGAGNIVRRSPGFAPYAVADAELEEFHGEINGNGYNESRWLSGKVTSDPDTIATTGLPGLGNSRISDTAAGLEYINTDATSTGWEAIQTA